MVAAQRVAGAVVEVAFLKDIAGEFPVRSLGRVIIARESGLCGDGDEDLAAAGVGDTGGEAGGGVAGDGAGDGVGGDGDVGGVGEEAEEEAVLADGVGGVGVAAVVEGCKDAFCGGEEFGNGRDGEAGLEAGPDVGAHAVAEDAADAVGGVEGGGRGREQVARGFADVGEVGGGGGVDVWPEGLGAEAEAEGGGDAGEEEAEGVEAAGAVVERHTVVPGGAVGAGVGIVAGGEDGRVDGGVNVVALGCEGDGFGETGGAAEKGVGVR